PREVPARIDTLWIDTDREVFVVTWRGVTPLASPPPVGVGRVVAAARPQGASISFDEVDAVTRPQAAPPIAGARWAGTPAPPVPRPGTALQAPLPIGASLAAFVPAAAPSPRQSGRAPKKAPSTMVLQQVPEAPVSAPFPIAGPRTG